MKYLVLLLMTGAFVLSAEEKKPVLNEAQIKEVNDHIKLIKQWLNDPLLKDVKVKIKHEYKGEIDVDVEDSEKKRLMCYLKYKFYQNKLYLDYISLQHINLEKGLSPKDRVLSFEKLRKKIVYENFPNFIKLKSKNKNYESVYEKEDWIMDFMAPYLSIRKEPKNHIRFFFYGQTVDRKLLRDQIKEGVYPKNKLLDESSNKKTLVKAKEFQKLVINVPKRELTIAKLNPGKPFKLNIIYKNKELYTKNKDKFVYVIDSKVKQNILQFEKHYYELKTGKLIYHVTGHYGW